MIGIRSTSMKRRNAATISGVDIDTGVTARLPLQPTWA